MRAGTICDAAPVRLRERSPADEGELWRARASPWSAWRPV